MQPKVSIIIPVFNGERYIIECFEALINQTYSNWECIIFNDNSFDKSEDIINEYIQKDFRFKYIKSNLNIGAGMARNECIKIARGEYIAIQDIDDISLNNRIEDQVKFLDSNLEFGFVTSNNSYFDENSEFSYFTSSCVLDKNSFIKGMPFAHTSLMIRTNILKVVNGYPKYRRIQDYSMMMEVISKGYIGFKMDNILVKYRVGLENYKRRTIESRFLEVKIRFSGYKKMNVHFRYYFYILKPLFSALFPKKIMEMYHKKMRYKL